MAVQYIADAWKAAYLTRVGQDERGADRTPSSIDLLDHLRRWSVNDVTQHEVRRVCASLGLALVDSLVTKTPPPDRATDVTRKLKPQ
jgi:hypothetical protein